MKKLILNFYLFVIFALVIQAVYVVFSSNSTITDSLKVKAIQAQNVALTNELNVLEDKITMGQALSHLTSQPTHQALVSIDRRQLVTGQTFASRQ